MYNKLNKCHNRNTHVTEYEYNDHYIIVLQQVRLNFGVSVNVSFDLYNAFDTLDQWFSAWGQLSTDEEGLHPLLKKSELALVRHLHSNVFLVLKVLVAEESTSI